MSEIINQIRLFLKGRIYFTNSPLDWDFGIGVSMPQRTYLFLQECAVYYGFEAYIYIGPFTINYEKSMPVEIDREDL